MPQVSPATLLTFSKRTLNMAEEGLGNDAASLAYRLEVFSYPCPICKISRWKHVSRRAGDEPWLDAVSPQP